MRAIHLRPVEPADYPALRRFELDLTLGPRWRHRGATPSPEAFVQTLWNGALAVCLVQGGHRPDPLGLVSAYGHDLQSGFAWVAAARFDPDDHPTPFLLGLQLFTDHLFATWPLRKLYAEVLAPNLAPFASAAGGLFAEEGVLRAHAYVDGGYVDQHLLALTRESWVRARARWGHVPPERAAGPPPLDALVAELLEVLDRGDAPLDVDLPLADQGLDSLHWLVIADHLEQCGSDPDLVTQALLDHVTLRAVHRRLVEAHHRSPTPLRDAPGRAESVPV
jgi:aryl carrier-like protein